MEDRVRIIIEVVAGVLPGTPMHEYDKRFIISSNAWYAQGQWEGKKEEAAAHCRQVQQEANDYMLSLWNPSGVNWVKCEWIYF